ncbi:hypothetical protein LTR64_008756 [Lithohypha guttulata]|uniref:uncharacterized protein n=1 Tax=Lithohypha guttulata TaxID=1690604 RepID=UPI00315C967C
MTVGYTFARPVQYLKYIMQAKKDSSSRDQIRWQRGMLCQIKWGELYPLYTCIAAIVMLGTLFFTWQTSSYLRARYEDKLQESAVSWKLAMIGVRDEADNGESGEEDVLQILIPKTRDGNSRVVIDKARTYLRAAADRIAVHEQRADNDTE